MASSGSGIGTPLGNDPQAIFQARIELAHAKIKRSASWFDWIAAFSVVNALISLANGNWHFLLGLGITEVITFLSGKGQGLVIGLVLTAIVAAFFWGMCLVHVEPDILRDQRIADGTTAGPGQRTVSDPADRMRTSALHDAGNNRPMVN